MRTSIYAILFAIFFLTACATSRITNSWKSEDQPTTVFKKLLILGLLRDKDRNFQMKMENHMVDDLKEKGIQAISAMQEFGPKTFEGQDEVQALEKIKNNGFDAVLTIVMLDKEKERRYVPGHIYYSPFGWHYNRFWGYYGTMYHRIYEPGYYVSSTKYFWESNLYDMNSQKLVYSVQSESFDPATSEALGHEYGQMIINDMVNKGILK
ncbi:MAG: hypothetical protein ACO29O_08325 [Chitinophagaceae bacterium]